MPNYIKNRLSFDGPKEDIQQLILKFSTSFDRTPSLAHDGELIYVHKDTGEPGWFNEKTGKFSRREHPDADVIPTGFEQKLDEAWTRFPDFDKIAPMPKGMESNPHSGISIWIEICTGQVKFYSNPDMSSMDGILGSMKMTSAMRALQGDKNVSTLSDAEFEMFIQGVRNYREHGFVSWYEWSIKNWGTKWNCSECEKIDEFTYLFQTAWNGVPALVDKMSKEFPEVLIMYTWSDEDTGCNCGIGEYKGGEVYLRRLENQSKEAYDLCFELWPSCKENYKLIGDTYEYIEDAE